MELKGKKICFLGDSITEGAVASKIENCYWKKLGEKTGANVLGFGIGGTRVAPKKIKTESYDNLDFQIRYKEIPSDADVIVVMNDGKITGVGTHDELLQNNAEYSEICYSQMDKES